MTTEELVNSSKPDDSVVVSKASSETPAENANAESNVIVNNNSNETTAEVATESITEAPSVSESMVVEPSEANAKDDEPSPSEVSNISNTAFTAEAEPAKTEESKTELTSEEQAAATAETSAESELAAATVSTTPRSQRVRKAIDRYDASSASTPHSSRSTPARTPKKDSSIVSLGSFEGIVSELGKRVAADETVQFFHRILYNRVGEANKRKADIRAFSGFGEEFLNHESKERVALVGKLSKATNSTLKEICAILNLKVSGDKNEIINRILDFLATPTAEAMRVHKATTPASGKKTPSGSSTSKRRPSSPTRKTSGRKKRKSDDDDNEDGEEEMEEEIEEELTPTANVNDVEMKDANEEAVVEEEKAVEQDASTEEEKPKTEQETVAPAAVEEEKPAAVVEEEKTAAVEEVNTTAAVEEEKATHVTAPVEEEKTVETSPVVIEEIFSTPSNAELTSFIEKQMSSSDLESLTKNKIRTLISESFTITEELINEKKSDLNNLIEKIISSNTKLEE